MEFQNKLYNDLLKLIEKSEAFYFKDFFLDSRVYRIFSYRLASWSLFQYPNALNCRGTMFDITGSPILVSLPPEKFFNYEEGGIDHSKGVIGSKMVKLDGSLISTYIHNGELRLKTKGSLSSSQAIDAMRFLESNTAFKEELFELAQSNLTVNLEYTSPENRVVVPYQVEKLTILSVRNNINGETLHTLPLLSFLDDNNFALLKDNVVDFTHINSNVDHNKFVEDIRLETFGEGYVVEIIPHVGESYLTKVKNIKYVALHHTKDTVNNTRSLFEAIIEEASDDLRSMFHDDPYILDKISKMEATIQPIFNHVVNSVENFYCENKSLDRKSYAIKAQNENPTLMPLFMNMFLGKEINYKEFAKKHRKDIFGIQDSIIIEE